MFHDPALAQLRATSDRVDTPALPKAMHALSQNATTARDAGRAKLFALCRQDQPVQSRKEAQLTDDVIAYVQSTAQHSFQDRPARRRFFLG